MKTEFFDDDGRCINDDMMEAGYQISDIVKEFIKVNRHKISGLHELRGMEAFLQQFVTDVTLEHILGGIKCWRIYKDDCDAAQEE